MCACLYSLYIFGWSPWVLYLKRTALLCLQKTRSSCSCALRSLLAYFCCSLWFLPNYYFKIPTVQISWSRFLEIHHVPCAALKYHWVVRRSVVPLHVRRLVLLRCAPSPPAAGGRRGPFKAAVISPHLYRLSFYCPLGLSCSPDLNNAHQSLHHKWSPPQRDSALPLRPSLLSHRSARCFDICSPNHSCDTGQSHTHKHTHVRTLGHAQSSTHSRAIS